MKEPKPGDRVRIVSGGPHENFGRIATLSYPYLHQSAGSDGDWVLYFGDDDEDEFVYSPNEWETI